MKIGRVQVNHLMDSSLTKRASTEVTEIPDLAAVLDLVRAGMDDAAGQLRRILTPGVRFLMRRRLGRDSVDRETQSVLEAAIHIAQTDHSMRPENLASMVRGLIEVYCAEQGRASGTVESWENIEPSDVAVAGRILGRMSAIEREALRRCYVLGEAPESFLETLRLTPQEFRTARARARAEYRSWKARAHVA